MNLIDIFLIGVGLSMDAFAVSLCKGLSVKQLKLKHMILCGLYFGIFQALMPTIGYFLGTYLKDFIDSIDHWIAFILLTLIGINMIKESFEEEHENDDFSIPVMIALAIATSIDAFAIGVSFSFYSINLLLAVSIIGVTTFVLSSTAVYIGHQFGIRYKQKAEIMGGIILILLGIRLLISGLM